MDNKNFDKVRCMRTIVCSVALLFFLMAVDSSGLMSQSLPKITFGVEKAEGPQDIAVTLQILFMLTILSLAPAILILMTSFTRIIIVFHFLRQAVGLQTMPTNQLLIGFALFLTFFIMMPVGTRINEQAVQPYLNGKISLQSAFDKGKAPLHEFMFKHTRKKDLGLILRLSKTSKPSNKTEIPTHALIPAFVMSESKLPP